MRLRLAITVVVLQLIVLAYMAGGREWILRTGQTMVLRTAPIDPNDPMRGDYARLSYDISSVTKDQCRDGALKMFASNGYVYSRQWRDTPVYATMKLNDSGIAELVSVSDQKPANGLFLRGRIDAVSERTLSIRYGIEAFFMQQGAAQNLEDLRRTEKSGVPLDVTLAVGGSGTAMLKDYRWEPLGLVATFERTSADQATASENQPLPRQFITAVRLEIKNHGSQNIALIDLPKAGSFRLVNDRRWQEPRYQWVGIDQPAQSVQAGNLVVLKPGEIHTTRIDLTQPGWFVVDTKSDPTGEHPVSLQRDLGDWAASFRIEYSSPTRTAVGNLPGAEIVYHGALYSRPFAPSQARD